jgi:trigger factor
MTELQVSIEARDGLERRMRIQVPAARIDNEVATRLSNVGRSARIKGFRPGKAPAKVIRQRYGDQVRQEVLQEVLQNSYSEAISREKLRPAGGPRIEPENLEDGKDLTYVAVFEIYPEVELKGLESIKVKRPVVEVGDSDAQAMLEKLRAQRATWKAVELPAAAGHQARVDFDGTLDGEPLEGGKGEDVAIVIGEGQMLEDFEKNLIGMQAGEEKTFKLKFPKDYHAEQLAGKKASFAVKVREVAERELPQLDEGFVKGFGVESGKLDDLLADVRRNMEREAADRVRAEIKGQVMEGLLEANAVPVPGVLVEEEARGLQAETMRRAGVTDQSAAPAVETFRETAERRVRLGLLIGAFIEQHGVQVDRDRVRQKVEEICAPYDQPEEIVKLYLQNAQLLGQVENVVLEEQVVEMLLAKAKVKDDKRSFEELMGS